MSAKHFWVELKVMPVMLEESKTTPGNIDVFVTPHQEEFAEADIVHCCWICDVRATVENLDAECPGKSTNSDSP